MGKIIKRQIRGVHASGEVEAELRQLAPSDISQIRTIAKESFEKVWTDTEFSYFVSHASGFCWGLHVEGNLTAYFLSLLVLGELDIISIAVAPFWRRSGLAEMLMEFVWNSLEVRRGFLEVEADNGGAIALYEKCGFERYGIRRKYYAGKKDALLMKKEKS